MHETEKGNPIVTGDIRKSITQEHAHEVGDSRDGLEPTEEEKAVLRRVAGTIPITAYLLCVIEFAERASWYGVTQVFGNFINRPLPANGNGAGYVNLATSPIVFCLFTRVLEH